MTVPNTPTLRSIVDRVNRLLDEKKELTDAIGEVYVEAKSNGHNVKALRRIVSEMRKPPDPETEALIDTYKLKLGLLAETPLGQAAVTRARTDIAFHAPADDEMKVAEPA